MPPDDVTPAVKQALGRLHKMAERCVSQQGRVGPGSGRAAPIAVGGGKQLHLLGLVADAFCSFSKAITSIWRMRSTGRRMLGGQMSSVSGGSAGGG